MKPRRKRTIDLKAKNRKPLNMKSTNIPTNMLRMTLMDTDTMTGKGMDMTHPHMPKELEIPWLAATT